MNSGPLASTFPPEPSAQFLHQDILISSLNDSNRAGSCYSVTILNKDYLSIMEKLLTSKWKVSNKFQLIRQNPHISRYSRRFWWGVCPNQTLKEYFSFLLTTNPNVSTQPRPNHGPPIVTMQFLSLCETTWYVPISPFSLNCFISAPTIMAYSSSSFIFPLSYIIFPVCTKYLWLLPYLILCTVTLCMLLTLHCVSSMVFFFFIWYFYFILFY